MSDSPLIQFSDNGLWCPQGKFFIDPWKPVTRAVVTHAHSDHARYGNKHYLAHHQSAEILKLRLGSDISLHTLPYNKAVNMNGVQVSFHPAGHITGSAQVRLEYKGEVWVVSGDYKTEPDGITSPFEPVKCHHFITECTFGMPVFKWNEQAQVIGEINQWWLQNKAEGKASIICAYALGKAQRIIASVDHSIGDIFVHGAVWNANKALERDGLQLPLYHYADSGLAGDRFSGALIVTPSSALGSPWLRKFHPYEIANVSGWMQIRGIKRRRNAGRGFVLSDHADWAGLLQAIKATEAENVYVTHGYTDFFARFLNENGWNAKVVRTQYEGEIADKPQ